MRTDAGTVPWHHRAAFRLLACCSLGAIAAVGSGRDFWVSGLVGWDVASSLLLLVYLSTIVRSDEVETRSRASTWDPGRTAVSSLVAVACAFSVAASIIMMGERHRQAHPDVLVGLCLWAVLTSWFLTHTTFTLRYAHLFYRGSTVGGLEFPGGADPDDLDFAYYAFTVGMCFQVSDVAVSERELRRTTLVHALISFFYNTAILALALNLIFGKVGNLG